MIPEPWLYTLLLVVGVAQGLAVLYAYRSRWRSTDGAEPADGTDQPAQRTEMTCPECGTTNERGYRYCWNCVSELPGGTSLAGGPPSPRGREIF